MVRQWFIVKRVRLRLGSEDRPEAVRQKCLTL
jgi:hypothetical protein